MRAYILDTGYICSVIEHTTGSGMLKTKEVCYD